MLLRSRGKFLVLHFSNWLKRHSKDDLTQELLVSMACSYAILAPSSTSSFRSVNFVYSWFLTAYSHSSGNSCLIQTANSSRALKLGSKGFPKSFLSCTRPYPKKCLILPINPLGG